MRRLSICFLVLTTLTACGGTDDGGDDATTTPDASTSDASITSDATTEADADEPEDDATDPTEDTITPVGCTSDDDCATDDVCEVATCDLTTGECATEHKQEGAECILDDSSGVCTEGECITSTCGDGVCDADEDADSCSDDCTQTGCGDAEVLGCDGVTCLTEAMLGDTLCDSALNCEENAWDGGDCDLCGNGLCGTGETATLCPEDCQNGEECGDSICMWEIGEDYDTCPEDCCPTGEVKDCENVSCVSDSGLGDGTCDPLLNCDVHDFDGGDCETSPSECGDGVCEDSEDALGCPADCETTDCGVGEVVGCDGVTCVDASWLGNGTCDALLDCEATQADGGDCEATPPATCGDGVCDPGEAEADSQTTGLGCATECSGEESCINGCIASEFGTSAPCSACFGPIFSCMFNQCLDICTSEGPKSEACDQCLEDNDCDEGGIVSCVMSTCNADELAYLGGSCNQDCEAPTDTCGDGFCQPNEKAQDPLPLAVGCYLGCDNTEDCATTCLVGGTGLSQGCAGCSVTEISCVVDNCYDACVNPDTESQDSCDTCAQGAGCGVNDYALCLATECDLDDLAALATTCPGDCDADDCLPGQVLSCVGVCHDAGVIGDGTCDGVLNCAAWDFDGGDCTGPACGDQVCAEGEEVSCPSDCAECSNGELANCSGGCSAPTSYGDGTCDIEFNCEPLTFDGGDCSATCGDGLCATAEGSLNIGPLAGQCAAGCAFVPECTTNCISGSGLTSSCAGCFSAATICVSNSCYDECFTDDNDQGACDTCAAACYGDTFNTCMVADCAADSDQAVLGGSCPMDCGDCAQGMVTDCADGCTPAGWLGDGTCQAELNCETTGLDMGDCVGGCGDDSCDSGEGPTDVMSALFACSMTCGSDITCITDCVILQTQVSFECAGCHSAFFGCMVDNCGANCDGTDEAACDECLGTAGCMEAVTACVPTDCSGPEDTALITGTCPADCLVCQTGETQDCFNTCAPEGWIGDGSCDPQMNCAQHAYDGGDCSCGDSEVIGCEGGCFKSSWIENQYCDLGLNCEEFGYDGGDCDTCGNGWCGPNENNSTCSEDCTEFQCESGKIETCDGLCVNSEDESSLGDGTCDVTFGCITWNWDGGDCCPPGESKDCYGGCANVAWVGDGVCQTNFGCAEWDFDDGDCIGCGDGECGIGETLENCAADCAAPTCADNEQLGCDWLCYPKSWFGDGNCDAQFQCEEAQWDGDDCCTTGFIKGCDGQCGWEAYLGDGGCTVEFDCLEMAQDNGDCGSCGDDTCNSIDENSTLCPDDCGTTGCGEGYLDDCFGGCTPAIDLGDDTCDAAFACSAWGWDEEDCCPDDQKPTCDGGCSAGSVYGDGNCDQEFNCADLSFDGGDCSACPEGEISTCEGFCFPDWLLGTGDCDQELNCEALEWDGGDCLENYCGDGTCDDNESLSNCLTDCEVACADGTIPGCWGGCVDGGLLTNGTCDDALACTYHDWDNDACGYCGDFVCDPTQENPSLCPGDCGVSSCVDDEVDGCEEGSCISASAVSDGTCDLGLSCTAWGWDDGDCCEDPEMQKVCGDLCAHPAWKYDGSCDPGLNCEAGEWDGGDCDECGDTICGLAESSWNCPEDCTEVMCADGEIESCDGGCVDDDGALGDGICDGDFACAALSWDDGDCCSSDELDSCGSGCVWEGNLGDGTCDESLNCAAHGNDDGDCCGDGLINGCDGGCVALASLGDGECDAALTCAETEWDGGDCCPPGFLRDCNEGCTSEEIFGDEVCDIAFACDALEWDDGTCCPADTQPNCNGGCSDSALFGDGACDDALACENTGWDSGDCCPTDELPICTQSDPDVLYCSYASALADGFCDPDFDCEMYGYDQGDCVSCGDGVCEADEDETTCASDCAPQTGEACGDSGIVDCEGGCFTGTISSECDQAFNCSEADWDWGECLDELPKLVINEVDVRADDGDSTDFIELYNPTDQSISLSGYALNIYTLSGGGINYTWVDLENTFAVVDGSIISVLEIAPGETLVVAQPDTLSNLPSDIAILEMPDAAVDNDDGAAVLSLGGGAVDSVAWSDDAEISIHGEGTAVAADSIAESLSRCPDGKDTDDNVSDFSPTPPTPGEANLCGDN